jgi:hypothetical protein
VKKNHESFALLILMGALLGGCTTVEPWERGTLAQPQMSLDPAPAQSALRTHIYNSREAASGGSGAEGGGCGCY